MQIVILGAGSFGTAVANQLAFNPHNKITLLVRDREMERQINEQHVNSKYFPRRQLHQGLIATMDYSVIASADLLLLAVPSKAMKAVAAKIKPHLSSKLVIVNMAKGLMENGNTIVEYLQEELRFLPVISLKGASFSIEMINSLPTLMTVGFHKKEQLDRLLLATENTNIFLDYTNDVKGVELLSALKNIYAMALGNIDANFNAVNTRFLVLTKAVEEIKYMINAMGGREETIFLCCGIGDISLTGLSDLSRNRTLGLLIGKGFYSGSLTENSVVLEGLNTLRLVDKLLPEYVKQRIPLFQKVKEILMNPSQRMPDFNFQDLFRREFKTVITYGTFDLLHYGHVEILRRIKERADQVIVGLSTDEFNKEKGKRCIMSYEKRKQLLEGLSYVNLVIPETRWDQKVEDIQTYGVDLFIMGDDWAGKFDYLKSYCEVAYLPRTKGISTSKLKDFLAREE